METCKWSINQYSQLRNSLFLSKVGNPSNYHWNLSNLMYDITQLIWNRHGHECLQIWKLSGNYTLIQCIKKCRDWFGPRYIGDNFLGPNLVSFNRTIVPYEISKVNFRVETKIIVSMSEEILSIKNKIWL